MATSVELEVLALRSRASNLHLAPNPPYTAEDFEAVFPAFKVTSPSSPIPSIVFELFLELANDTVKETRFKKAWKYGMALFLAHHCTRYLETAVPSTAEPSDILAAGRSKGLVSSESVGPISVSYDHSWVTTSYKGWGDMATTTYGQQYISLAKPMFKPGMYVW